MSNGKRRRNNPGPMWRANLLLRADLQERIVLQALHEGKSVSVFVDDVLTQYLAAVDRRTAEARNAGIRDW